MTGAENIPNASKESLSKAFRNPIPKSFKKVLSDSEKQSDLLVNKSEKLIQDGRFSEALLTARKAVALGPTLRGRSLDAHALVVLGEAYLNVNDGRQALQSFTHAKQTSGGAQINSGLALSYCQVKQYDDARKVFVPETMYGYRSSWARELPNRFKSRELEASIRLSRGLDRLFTSRSVEASREFLHASKLAPRNGLVAYWTGESLLQSKRPAEARDYFAIAAKYANGRYRTEAKALVENIDVWFKQNPDANVGSVMKVRTSDSTGQSSNIP